MVATRLRWTLALELLGAFLALRAFGTGPAYAFALALAALFALHVMLILATFAIAWPRARSASFGKGPSSISLCAMIAAECLAYFALFAIIQPFEALFARIGTENTQGAKWPPVMFVHGYLCNRGMWWWLLARLAAHGVAAKPINLEPPLGSIDTLSERLHEYIEAYLRETQNETLVLVTHSMGGLVARAYLKRHGSARVTKLISLACPHHGTRIAYLGFGRNARQMQPGSDWICELSKSEPLTIPAVSVWSAHDNFVAPQKSSRLEGAREIVLDGLGHLSFAFSRRVVKILLQELC